SADRLKGDAALAARRFTGPIEAATPEALTGADAIVDALFGAGLDRPIEGRARDMITAMNAARATICAGDLPSGVNGTTGAAMGGPGGESETVPFSGGNRGHLLLRARLHCGRVSVADIGTPADSLRSIRPRTFANGLALWTKVFPLPRVEGHK